MSDLEQRIKLLEIEEKKLKNKTFWWVIITPILTIVVTLITTLLTINTEFSIDKQNYTQDQISTLLQSSDIIQARKKIQFLLEAELVGDDLSRKKILQALNNNLIDPNLGTSYFISGMANLSIAKGITEDDSSAKYYLRAINDFIKDLEFEPNNYDARINLGLCYANIGAKYDLDYYFERAIVEYDKVLVKLPNYDYLMARKIYTLEKLNRKKEICELLKKIDTKDLSQDDIDRCNRLGEECK